MNFFLFISTFSTLLLSIIGYGLFFSKKLTNYNNYFKKEISLGYVGIFGIFLSVLISYLTSLVTAHNNVHNIIFIVIGFLFFIYFLFTNKKKILNKYFFLSYILSFLALFYFKSHDDFSYYHLSSIINLTENKLEFGIHHFDIAFNHSSSLFYFHSLFKTFLTGNFFYQLGPLSIIIFTNTILFEKILKKKNNFNLDIVFYLSIFFLIFINIFFYRLAEHGTDRSAQILFFLTFILCIELIDKKKFSHDIFELIIIIFTLIISFKSFYILYSILLIFIYFKYFKILNFFEFLKKFSVTYLCLLIILLMINHNIATSGCLIYPVVLSCFENFFWGYGKENVISAMQWYELWSKAGASPNYVVENQFSYISSFNWVPNWLNNYFFNKMQDFLLGVLFVLLVFTITFKIKFLSLRNYNKYIFLYLILLILLAEWFYNHPALRYGGYVLIYLILISPLSLIMANQKYTFKGKLKSIKVILIITIFIFAYRNIDRLINENNIYAYNLFKNPVYNIQKNYFTMQNKKKDYFYDPLKCMEENSKKEIVCKKISGYNFYYKN